MASTDVSSATGMQTTFVRESVLLTCMFSQSTNLPRMRVLLKQAVSKHDTEVEAVQCGVLHYDTVNVSTASISTFRLQNTCTVLIHTYMLATGCCVPCFLLSTQSQVHPSSTTCPRGHPQYPILHATTMRTLVHLC